MKNVIRSTTAAVASAFAAASFSPAKAEAPTDPLPAHCELGLAYDNNRPNAKGLPVGDVDPEGNAYASGIRPGDLIIAVGKNPYAKTGENRDNVSEARGMCKPFDVTVQRNAAGSDGKQHEETKTLHVTFKLAHPHDQPWVPGEGDMNCKGAWCTVRRPALVPSQE
jgi:S1-C subfamily serine protease